MGNELVRIAGVLVEGAAEVAQVAADPAVTTIFDPLRHLTDRRAQHRRTCEDGLHDRQRPTLHGRGAGIDGASREGAFICVARPERRSANREVDLRTRHRGCELGHLAKERNILSSTPDAESEQLPGSEAIVLIEEVRADPSQSLKHVLRRIVGFCVGARKQAHFAPRRAELPRQPNGVGATRPRCGADHAATIPGVKELGEFVRNHRDRVDLFEPKRTQRPSLPRRPILEVRDFARIVDREGHTTSPAAVVEPGSIHCAIPDMHDVGRLGVRVPVCGQLAVNGDPARGERCLHPLSDVVDCPTLDIVQVSDFHTAPGVRTHPFSAAHAPPTRQVECTPVIAEPDSSTLVTVVIAMRNEAARIGACLESVLANVLPHGQMECLVLDGDSQDSSARIVGDVAARDPRVRLISNPDRLQAGAFNRGLAEARGTYLVRMDAHSTYAPNYIAECVRLLEATGAANVGGVQRAAGTDAVSGAIAAAVSSPFAAGDASYRHATRPGWVDTVYLGAWRTDTLRQLGGMRTDLAVNEDYEMNVRLRKAGGQIYLSPTIQSTYFVRASLPKLASQYGRYGFWKVRTLVDHPGSLRWRQLVAPAFVLSVLLAPLLVARFGAIGALHLGLYATANVGASLVVAARSSWTHLPVLPIAFAIIHVSWGAGFWAGIVRWGMLRWIR